jgi:nucleolar protein 4
MVEASATVRVAHLGLGVTDQALEDVFSDYGPIKRCFVVKPKTNKNNNKPVNNTIGYVEFAIPEDAETAISEINVKSQELGIPGTSITVTSAPDRQGNETRKTKKEDDSSKQNTPDEKGDRQEFAQQKKARLIVRNIPWKSTDATLRTHFGTGTGGKVVDVNILKKKDGKMVGCAFIQLSSVAEAAKAIKQLNGKPFLDRPIAVDWAVSKDQFSKGNTIISDAKKSSNDDQPSDDSKDDNDDVVLEDDKSISDESVDGDNIEDDDSEEDAEMGLREMGRAKLEGTLEPSEDTRKKKIWPKTGHDISENKTVFVRNISFDSEQDDLRDMMDENFGKVHFARLVIDKATEHPKVSQYI